MQRLRLGNRIYSNVLKMKTRPRRVPAFSSEKYGEDTRTIANLVIAALRLSVFLLLLTQVWLPRKRTGEKRKTEILRSGRERVRDDSYDWLLRWSGISISAVGRKGGEVL